MCWAGRGSGPAGHAAGPRGGAGERSRPARAAGPKGENKGRERPGKGESQMKKKLRARSKACSIFSNLISLILFQMGFKSI